LKEYANRNKILYYRPAVSSPSTSITEKPGREPKEPPPPPQEYAILLADPELMELPLEALKVFQAESIVSLTRDFSLQLFYHRYHQDNPEGEVYSLSFVVLECPCTFWAFIPVY
jgi:hypothetical protein